MKVAILSAVLALSPLVAAIDADVHFKGWANYKHLRPRDAPAAQVSPLPNEDSKSIQLSVQTQIRVSPVCELPVVNQADPTSPNQNDINAVTQEFTALPSDVQNLLKTALNNQLKQSIYKQDPAAQLAAIQSSVDTAFNKVQNSISDILLNNITDITDASDLQALKDCIGLIVAKGGRQSEEEGTCLTTSGYTLASLQDQFNMFGECPSPVKRKELYLPSSTVLATDSRSEHLPWTCQQDQ